VPLPRYNTMVAVLKKCVLRSAAPSAPCDGFRSRLTASPWLPLGSTLYLYGGILETESREYTMDDFHTLNLEKLDRFTCLRASGLDEEEWNESDEDDDSSGSEDDDNDDDGSDDGEGGKRRRRRGDEDEDAEMEGAEYVPDAPEVDEEEEQEAYEDIEVDENGIVLSKAEKVCRSISSSSPLADKCSFSALHRSSPVRKRSRSRRRPSSASRATRVARSRTSSQRRSRARVSASSTTGLASTGLARPTPAPTTGARCFARTASRSVRSSTVRFRAAFPPSATRDSADS
jgi:hypothetical protein